LFSFSAGNTNCEKPDPKKAADYCYHLYKATKVHAFAFPGLFKVKGYFEEAFIRQINYSILNDPVPIAGSLAGFLQSGTTNHYLKAYLPESLQDSIAAPHGPKVYNNVIQDIANASDFSSYLLRLKQIVYRKEDWEKMKEMFVRRVTNTSLKVFLFATIGFGFYHFMKTNDGFSQWIHQKLSEFSVSHILSFFQKLLF
jgi:hypothetical protein